MASPLVIVYCVLVVALIAVDGRKAGGRRRQRRCKYNKAASPWSACDPTLQVKIKVAQLEKSQRSKGRSNKGSRGRNRCPGHRTFTKPCDGERIMFNGCEYRQVFDWSECDLDMATMTRTLELVTGTTQDCDNTRVESKECGKVETVTKGNQTHNATGRMKNGKNKRKKQKKRRRKNKRRKGRRRKQFKLQTKTECSYKDGEWSECDPNTGLQNTVQTLSEGSDGGACEKSVVMNRRCSSPSSPSMMMVPEPGGQEVKVKVEEGRRGKVKGKKKTKKDKKRNKKKKEQREALEKPPRPAEIHVVPYTTFVMVTWTPPQPGPFGDEVPVTGYLIGYGRGFPDVDSVEVNASEFSYKIEDLEPGREYVISVRAQNHMGAGQALYETVITRIPDGDEFKPIFPPVGLRAIVMSANAINVTWMDMAMKRVDTATEEREYFLRYRQLKVEEVGGMYHNLFMTLKTKRSYLVVSSLQPATKYEFAVLASSVKQNSTWSMMVWNITHEAVPSTPPDNLTVIIDPGSPGQVTLNWQPPPQPNGIITGYEVSYSTAAVDGRPLVGVMDTKGNRLSVTLTSLVPGVIYDLSVKARNSQGLGPPFTVENYKLPGDPSPVPASLTALPTGPPYERAVTLVWDLPVTLSSLVPGTDNNTNILGFVILYTSEMKTEHVTWKVKSEIPPTSSSSVIQNLEPGREYFFKIQAHTRLGFGPESNTVAFQIPLDEVEDVSTIEAPKMLQVVVLSSTSAVLSWRDPHLARVFEDSLSPSPQYSVRYRALDPSPSPYTLVSPPFTSLYLVDLQPLTRYQFSVRVHLGKEMSDWSVPTENTTFAADFSQPPLKVKVKGQPGAPEVVILTWQPGSGSRIKEYIVMFSSDPSKPHKNWLQKAAVPQDIRTQTFPHLAPETTYYFFIQAMTDLGFGPRSKVVSYSTPKGDKTRQHVHTIDKLRATVVSSTSVVLSWHDRDRGKVKDKVISRLARYSVRYRPTTDVAGGYTFTNSTFTSVFIGGLRPATQFEFSVCPNVGSHMTWSIPVVNTTTEMAPDTAPGHLSAEMFHNDPTTVMLTWQPPPFPNGEITNFHLYYTTDMTLSRSKFITVGGLTVAHPVTQLRPRTNYFFRVGAENKEGAGPLSEPIAYRTPRVRGAPPQDVTVIPAPDNPYDAIVAWQPPPNNSRKIKSYSVIHQTEVGLHRQVTSVHGSALTARLVGLTPSTTYHLTVQPHYRRGAGPHSQVAAYSIPKELIVGDLIKEER